MWQCPCSDVCDNAWCWLPQHGHTLTALFSCQGNEGSCRRALGQPRWLLSTETMWLQGSLCNLSCACWSRRMKPDLPQALGSEGGLQEPAAAFTPLAPSSCSERGPSPSLRGCGSPGTSPRCKTHGRGRAGAAGTLGGERSGRPRRVPRAARAG